MDNKNKELAQKEAAKLLNDGNEVMSGGLIYRIIDEKLNRIDGSGNATPIGADVETFTRMHHCYLPREYYYSIFDLFDGVEYYAENEEAIYRRNKDRIEYQTTTGEWKGACFHAGVPKFCPVVEKEYKAEQWIHSDYLDKILGIVKKSRDTGLLRSREGWIWTKNSRCKYIDIRIDMRDGDFVLFDRSGQRISIEELEKQH